MHTSLRARAGGRSTIIAASDWYVAIVPCQERCGLHEYPAFVVAMSRTKCQILAGSKQIPGPSPLQ